ncbi:MAG: Ig-like domain-containing protein [Haliea sp.]|nr:Ig-like domain-containing protein [Haliea sp.]
MALSTGAAYSLSLDGLCDYAGNALATTVLSFTTAASGAADTTGPVLQAIVPASNATDVAVTSTVTITYDEGAQPADGPVVTGAGITVPGIMPCRVTGDVHAGVCAVGQHAVQRQHHGGGSCG